MVRSVSDPPNRRGYGVSRQPNGKRRRTEYEIHDHKPRMGIGQCPHDLRVVRKSPDVGEFLWYALDRLERMEKKPFSVAVPLVHAVNRCEILTEIGWQTNVIPGLERLDLLERYSGPEPDLVMQPMALQPLDQCFRFSSRAVVQSVSPTSPKARIAELSRERHPIRNHKTALQRAAFEAIGYRKLA